MVDKARIVSALVELELDLVAAYLFGSAARNQLRKGSDFDLGVLTAGVPLLPVQRWELQEQLAAQLNRNIDLIKQRGSVYGR